jgi:2',3'-cyclic-nucleotide 2'-phosphodiesterase (5'-nucleotidase family)
MNEEKKEEFKKWYYSNPINWENVWQWIDSKLKQERDELKTAIVLLRDIADLQNGSPLVTYKKEWRKTMDNIYAFLKKHEPTIKELEK